MCHHWSKQHTNRPEREQVNFARWLAPSPLSIVSVACIINNNWLWVRTEYSKSLCHRTELLSCPISAIPYHPPLAHTRVRVSEARNWRSQASKVNQSENKTFQCIFCVVMFCSCFQQSTIRRSKQLSLVKFKVYRAICVDLHFTTPTKAI